MNPGRSANTLIELLIVIAVIGIIIPVVFHLAMEPLNQHRIDSERVSMLAEFAKVHRMLERDVRSASRIIPAMDNISCDTQSLILEIPIRQEAKSALEIRRVHYHWSEESATGARVFHRDLYIKSEDGWEQMGSYPLSRELNEVQLEPLPGEWEQAKGLRIHLSRNAIAHHKELYLSSHRTVALRGARP